MEVAVVLAVAVARAGWGAREATCSACCRKSLSRFVPACRLSGDLPTSTFIVANRGEVSEARRSEASGRRLRPIKRRRSVQADHVSTSSSCKGVKGKRCCGSFPR